VIASIPVAAILGAALLPLRAWAQQALILCTLVWFNTYIIFDASQK